MKRAASKHGVLAVALLIAASLSARSEMPRKQALAKLESNSAEVVRLMNDDPDNMAYILLQFMADPIGDQPKVLETCIAVIKKSRNPKSVRSAIAALGTIHHLHKEALSSNQKLLLEQGLQNGLTKREVLTRLDAARIYRELGSKFSHNSANATVGVFSEIGANKLSDEEHLRLLLEVLSLIDEKNPRLRVALRDVAKKQDLTNFMSSLMASGHMPGSAENNSIRLQKLRSLIQ